MPKLKVYRTPAGFYDAYVAAPSQKAALEAWGADSNLFARGVAELVTDPTFADAPLAEPGKVIKVTRGSEAEHLGALPKDRPAARQRSEGKSAPVRASKRRHSKPPPRPSRADLDAAEADLERHDLDLRNTVAELEAERSRIAAQITALRKTSEAARAKLESRVSQVRRRYENAIGRWRDKSSPGAS